MLTIGLSVTLLSIITLVDGNLNQQFSKSLPADTPSYFLLDVQTQQLADVKTQAEAVSGFGGLNAVPMLRGRVTHMAGVPAAQLRPPEDVDWVLRGIAVSPILIHCRKAPNWLRGNGGRKIIRGQLWSR